MTKDKALKLALDALEGFIPYLPLEDETQCNRYDKAITALRLTIDAQNMASKFTYKEQLETNEYERGFIDGMQKQMQSSVDKAVNAMSKREWVGLTEDEIHECFEECCNLKVVDPKGGVRGSVNIFDVGRAIEAKLKERNK
jgi:uncharacterized protein YnzC (UPF0291/DUF896 family)